MPKKSFDKAFSELQTILEDIQGDSVSIDKLSDKIKKAKSLISHCKERLREIESEIKDNSE